MKKNKIIIVGSILSICLITLSVILINNSNNYQNKNEVKTNNNYEVTSEMKANSLSYDNSKTNLDCKDAQCVIDTLAKIAQEKSK